MWNYNNLEIKALSDIPESAIGFVYLLEHNSGKKYIGKKLLNSKKTLPPLKGYKRKRKIVKESDWLNYYGSNLLIKQMIKEGKQTEFTRYILEFAYSKKQLTYLETKYLFKYEVLEHPDLYWNDTILGKFYHKDTTIFLTK
jgi:hypothetical protein